MDYELLIAVGFGSAAGAVNAVWTGNMHPFPRRVRLGARRHAVCLGFVGNVVVGAMASLAIAWILAAKAGGPYSTALVACVAALALTRAIASEIDKMLLRHAVTRAAAAPAADPQTIEHLERLPPPAMVVIAEGLMPRHTRHRLHLNRENS